MNTDKIYAESIAKEYAPKDNSKIVALRKLDAKAKTPANIFTYTFGIIMALIAGTGMSLSMQVIGGTVPLTILGIVVGIIGFIGMGVNGVYKNLFNDIFNPVLTRFDFPEKEMGYILKFYLVGITTIVMEWVDNNCTDSVDFICKIIKDCIIGKLNEQDI